MHDMTKPELRFSKLTNKEYDLFSQVMPHQTKMQEGCVNILTEHLCSISGTAQVLEIGFGTGITTAGILDTNSNVYLTAVDNEPAMMVRAKENLREFDESRLKLIGVEAFEFLKSQPDEFFDAVITMFVLHNIKDDARKAIISEVFRVLKKDGVFVNGDKLAVSDPATHKSHLDWQLEKFDIFDEMKEPELKTLWTKHYLEDESTDLIFFENDYVEYLKMTGFKNVSVTQRFHLDVITYAVK